MQEIKTMYQKGKRNPEIAQELLIDLGLIRLKVKEMKSAWSSSSCDDCDASGKAQPVKPTTEPTVVEESKDG